MFKKTLIATAALAALVLGASAANAGYSINIGYGYGGGYGYGYHHSYRPSCYTSTRPVTIRVWDDYAYTYVYRTIYRDYRVCD